jgi:hypothetical protein
MLWSYNDADARTTSSGAVSSTRRTSAQLPQNGAPLRLASAGDATADRGKANGIGRCASFLSNFRRKTRR